jgi:hypothetical protein
MSKRPRSPSLDYVVGATVPASAPAPMVVNHGTINMYFSKASHTEAPAAPPPERWLPAPPPRGRLSQTMGGALRIKCNRGRNCTSPRNKVLGPSQFIPELNPRNKKKYLDAIDALASAIETKDGSAFEAARDTVDRLKVTRCAPCRAVVSKSEAHPKTTTGACKAEWKRLKVDVFHTCGVCGATRSMEANHRASFASNAKLYKKCVETEGEEVAERKYPKEERKLEVVSAYTTWACPSMGGVEGMRAEAEKCDPLCSMCHALDPSSHSSNERRCDPAKVEREDHDTDEKFDKAKRSAKYRMEKRDYNNGLKRAVGRCERPDCPCDGPSGGECKGGYEQCYDWDHIDPTTKECNISKIQADCRTLATAKLEIDAERAKCRLLCRNCHNTRGQWDI